MTEDGNVTSEVFTPKKSNLSRKAIEKNALRKSLASVSSERIPFRQTEDRPSYSKDHLNELKSSTPSTPKDLRSLSDVDDDTGKTLDVYAQSGQELYGIQGAIIPTEAEIKEKKERRARLANERDFISLDDDDGGSEISLLPRRKKVESRLVRDDEEVGEGFDEFVDDGRISLGKKAEREQKRKHKAEMRSLINEVEGSSDEDTDDSEADRNAAYEAAQTRAGMDGLQKDDPYDLSRQPKTPPRITPLPNLNACLERLQSALNSMDYSKMQKIKKMEEIQREKADIVSREIEIQELLKEAGKNYEKLRVEAGLTGTEHPSVSSNGQGVIEDVNSSRGLESIGNTPIASMTIESA